MEEPESSLEDEVSLDELSDERCDEIIFNALLEAHSLNGEVVSGTRAIH